MKTFPIIFSDKEEAIDKIVIIVIIFFHQNGRINAWTNIQSHCKLFCSGPMKSLLFSSLFYFAIIVSILFFRLHHCSFPSIMNNPHASLATLVLPVPQNPPGLADIANIVHHRERVAKRKLDDPTAVSDELFGSIMVEQHRVKLDSHFIFLFHVELIMNNFIQIINAVAAPEIAPAWFTNALAAALAPLNAKIDNMSTRMGNLGCCKNDDVVTPPTPTPEGNNPLPPNAPTTIGQLKALTGADLTVMENYYGLAHDGTEGQRRNFIMRKYGIIFSGIVETIESLSTRMGNSGCCEDNDVVTPPTEGNNPLPPNAPTTIGQLKALTGANLTAMLNYYGLPCTGKAGEKRKRVMRKYGVHFTYATSTTLQKIN
jgi:hypothetical protein